MRSERIVKNLILGVIAKELGSEIRIDRQVKMSDRILKALKETGSLQTSEPPKCDCKDGECKGLCLLV